MTETKTCPRCNGAKIIEKAMLITNSHYQLQSVVVVETCPICNGRGIIEVQKDSPTGANGRGW